MMLETARTPFTALPDCQSAQRSILFLIDQLTELGGAERMMFDLASALKEQGYRVTILTFRDAVSPEAYTLASEILVLPMTSCFTLQAVRCIATLIRIMREREVCLVQTYFESADLIGVIASRLAGVRNLCSSRRDMGFLRSSKHRLAYKLMTRFYTRIIAVSEGVGARHQQMDWIDSRRLAIIYNGVALERYDVHVDAKEVLLSLGIAADKPLVTTVANVNLWKGLDVFIRAAALVAKEDPDVFFAIAGDWTDRVHLKDLQDMAADAGISHCVRFLGRVEDVPSLLLSSDIFVLLSRSEGFPNVVIEAMAASLPVVATNVGGTPEAVIDGVTSYLVADQDHDAASRCILSLLGDAQTRKSMGIRGRKLVEEKFSKQTMVKRHLEVYDAILAA